MFASDRGLFDEVTLENYRYIFTGELPPAYLKSGANRTMISDAARQAPRSLWNSAQIAIAALVINLVLGAPAAFVYARYAFPGKKLTFMFLILSPARPDRRADHADLHDDPGGRTDRHQDRHHLRASPRRRCPSPC